MRPIPLLIGLVLALPVFLTIFGAGDFELRSETLEDIPIPPNEETTAFTSDSLPAYDVFGIVKIEVVTTWDQESVWLGLVSKSQRDACNPVGDEELGIPAGISLTCKGEDIEFLVGGPTLTDNELIWEMEPGEWYPCMGLHSSSQSNDKNTMNAQVSANLSLSGTSITVFAVFSLFFILLGFRKRV